MVASAFLLVANASKKLIPKVRSLDRPLYII